MNEQELLYAMAFTLIPGVPKDVLCTLMKHFQSAVEAYEYYSVHQDDEDVSPTLINYIRTLPQYLARARQEMEFVREKGIQILTLHHPDYPHRLLECPDAPIVLYYKGNASLNGLHMASMVGTRHCTEYGRNLCRTFLRDLAQLVPDVTVVSGLAYGIDVNVHQQALAQHLCTIGVLAHGLDKLYPACHKHIANEMVGCGGLLTEYMSGTIPDRFRFVQRNRIVAGISDCTIVVESKEKGGSLITADLAQMYYRDVFACPGRLTDEYSKGCNSLITDNKAVLLLTPQFFVDAMGWASKTVDYPIQRQLFVNLSAQEEKIVSAMKDYEPHSLNTLVVQCGIPIGQMHELLFELELKGMVKAMVGNQYRLLD